MHLLSQNRKRQGVAWYQNLQHPTRTTQGVTGGVWDLVHSKDDVHCFMCHWTVSILKYYLWLSAESSCLFRIGTCLFALFWLTQLAVSCIWQTDTASSWLGHWWHKLTQTEVANWQQVFKNCPIRTWFTLQSSPMQILMILLMENSKLSTARHFYLTCWTERKLCSSS